MCFVALSILIHTIENLISKTLEHRYREVVLEFALIMSASIIHVCSDTPLRFTPIVCQFFCDNNMEPGAEFTHIFFHSNFEVKYKLMIIRISYLN